MANKRKNNEETRRLLLSWVMVLAAHLQDEHGMTRSEALKRAYLVSDLLDGMGRGTVEFTYRKGTGKVRHARGTLCKGVSERFDNYEYKREAQNLSASTGIFTYWDLDAENFRPFTANRLMEIIEIRVK